ncbi:MAG: hypothetical protein ACLP8S_16885 [Solirubrobacteraceae bacterium]
MIEDVIAERWAKITDDHCVAVIIGLPEFGEVALDLVVHDQRDALVSALAAVLHGQRRRGDELKARGRDTQAR